LLTPATFAVESNGPEASGHGVRPDDLAFRRRRSLQYRTLLLLALGIAVVLWGSWWRVSEYGPHPDPPYRTLAAKLWAGPLPEIGFRSAQAPAKSHLKSVLHSLYESVSAQSGFVFVARIVPGHNAPGIDRTIPTVTSRPPPFQISLHS
jgi:hypothetical protein